MCGGASGSSTGPNEPFASAAKCGLLRLDGVPLAPLEGRFSFVGVPDMARAAASVRMAVEMVGASAP